MKFLQIGPEMKKKNRNCHVQLKYHTMTEPKWVVLLPGVKEDQMTGWIRFRPRAFWYFVGRWEKRSRAADVDASWADMKSYFCLSQFTLSTDWWRSDKMGSTACRAFVGSCIYWSLRTCHCIIFIMGCEAIPWTAQTEREMRLKQNDLRF